MTAVSYPGGSLPPLKHHAPGTLAAKLVREADAERAARANISHVGMAPLHVRRCPSGQPGHVVIVRGETFTTGQRAFRGHRDTLPISMSWAINQRWVDVVDPDNLLTRPASD